MTFYQIICGFLFILIFAYFLYTRKRTIKEKRMKKVLPKGNYKLSCIINKSLKMSKGKVLSQFGHAIDGIIDVMKNHPEREKIWRMSGNAKITLKASFEEIKEILYEVKKMRLPYYQVFDAGKTQIPTGSLTCLIIGPASGSELDPITGHLSLY